MNFNVGHLTKFSDHKPLYCSLKIKNEIISGEALLDSFEEAPVKYKIESSLLPYREAQETEEVQKALRECLETNCYTREDVMTLNEKLTKVYRNVADAVSPRKTVTVNKRGPSRSHKKRKAGTKMRPKSPWFDATCINAKRELNSLSKQYVKNPTDDELRNRYY